MMPALSAVAAAPSAPRAVGWDDPWPGLAAFEEGDREFFKGRDDEITALLRLIMREDLTFLWGFSGLGKTSLLKAGLFPRLREADVFPVHVRLHYQRRPAEAGGPDASRAVPTSLWEQCFDAIEEAAERWHYEIPSRGTAGSIWEYVRRRNDRFWGPGDRLVTPLLVFDQFEELFTHDRETAPCAEVIAAFFRDLSDAVSGCPPVWLLDRGSEAPPDEHSDYLYRPGAFKVLLSFREDYLAQVADFTTLVRAIDHNYYRLESMTFKQGLAVVAGGGHLIDQSSPEERDTVCSRIVERVAAAPTPTSHTSATVDPALLSLFCRELNANRLRQDTPVIDRTLVESAAASQIISGFYESCMSHVSEAARRFVEERLVLEDSRTRESVAEEIAAPNGLNQAELEFLIDKRILRREETTRRGQIRLELTHDVLIDPALAARARREAEAERRREEQDRREQATREHEDNERQQRAREQALIQERDAAERARLERELEVQAQRAEAQNLLARRRKRYVAALAVGVMVAAVMATAAFRLSHEQVVRMFIQAAHIQLARDPQLSAVFSARATEEAQSRPGPALALAAVALHRSVRAASHLSASFDAMAASPVLSPDGTRLALLRDGGQVLEVRDGTGFGHITTTIQADIGTQILAAYFLGRGAALFVVNSNGSLDRIDLATAGGVKTHLAGSAADERPGTAAPSRARTIDKWAFNPERGHLLVSSVIPIDYTPGARSSGDAGAATPRSKRWVSMADANAAEGRAWLWDRPLDTSALAEVVLGQNAQRYALVNRDGTTALMDTNGAVIATHAFDRGTAVRVSGNGSYVLGIPPPTRPGSAPSGPSVTIWSVADDVTKTVQLPGRDEILATVFSPDGRFLAVVQAPGIVQVWDLTKSPAMFAAPIVAGGVKFSPDSRELLSWDENVAQLWSLTSAGRQLRLVGHQDAIVGAAIAPKPGPIVTLTGSQARVWSRAAFDVVIETGNANGLRAVALSPDGRSVAAGGRNKRLIIADAVAGTVAAEVDMSSEVVSLAYSSDGHAVAAGLSSGAIAVHRLDDAHAPDRTLRDFRGPITSVTFARKDSAIAYAVQRDDSHGFAVLKDLKSGETLMERHIAGEIVSLTISADEGTLAASVFKLPGYRQAAETDAQMSFETFSTDPPAAAPPPSPVSAPALDDGPALPIPDTAPYPSEFDDASVARRGSRVSAAAGISRDLRFAVTTPFDRGITTWFHADRTLSREPALAFGDRARVVAVAPDGHHFAAGGERGLTHLYTSDRPFAEPVIVQESGPAVVALAFSARGDQLASATGDGTVTVYSFGVEALLDRARTIIGNRTLTSAECLSLGESCSPGVPAWKLVLRQIVQSLGFE